MYNDDHSTTALHWVTLYCSVLCCLCPLSIERKQVAVIDLLILFTNVTTCTQFSLSSSSIDNCSIMIKIIQDGQLHHQISFKPILQCLISVQRGFCSKANLDIPNGDYRIFTTSSVVKYTCNPGFILYGAEQLVCFGTKWSSDPPMCIGKFAFN